jgi:hypothetical protein
MSNNYDDDDKFIHNPCYLKRYRNPTIAILGVGDFDLCYELLHNIMFQNKLITNVVADDTVKYI